MSTSARHTTGSMEPITNRFNHIDVPLIAQDDAAIIDSAAENYRNISTTKERKCLALRPLTKLEATKMATITERQKSNRHQKQIVQHKEFHGPGFCLSPPIAHFKDFEVGKEYRQRIHLTNISYTFNEFKLEPLPLVLRTVLEVEYIPQSRMVAGKQSYIDVIFTPKENVEIDDCITISTKTGILQLPVQCQRKKCVVSASSNVFDFGSVVVGEVLRQSVKIRNDGALSIKFTVGGDALKLFQVQHAMSNASDAQGYISGRARDDNTLIVEHDTFLDGTEECEVLSNPIKSVVNNSTTSQSIQDSNRRNSRQLGYGAKETQPSLGEHPLAEKNADVSSEFELEGGDVLENGDGFLDSRSALVMQSATTDTNVAYKRMLSSKPDLSMPGKIVTVHLAPFSETTIAIVFSPLMPCTFNSNFYLSFENPEVEDIVLFIKGKSIDVPVFISKNSAIDFGCAFYDVLYRDVFEISNTTSATVKVIPQVPLALKNSGILEFVPKFGFVQPEGTLSFQVKFLPSPDVCRVLRRIQGTVSTSAAGGPATPMQCLTSAFPFKVSVLVNVSGQTMPLYLHILATLSHRCVRITEPSSGEIRLGVLYTNERVETVVHLTNDTSVKRVCGFVNIPSNIEVLEPFPSQMGPNHSKIIEMLPFETLNVRLAVRAGLGQFTQLVKIHTEHDDGCVLKVTGQGRSPPLLASPNVINFPPCPLGMDVSTAIILNNITSVTQEYHFLLLRRHGIFVEPVKGLVAPGEELALTVTFRATKDVVDLSVPPLDEIDEHENLTEHQNLTQKEESKHGRKNVSRSRNGKKIAIEERELIQAALEKEVRERRIKELKRKRELEIFELRKLTPWESSSDDTAVGVEMAEMEKDKLSNIPFPLHRTLLVPFRVNSVDPIALSVPTEGTNDNGSIRPLFIRVCCTVIKPTVTIDVVHDSPPHPITMQQGTPATAGGGTTKDAPQSLARGKGKSKPDASKSHTPSPVQDVVIPQKLPLEAKASFTPTTVLDFGCVPSEESVTRTLTIKNHFKLVESSIGAQNQQPASLQNLGEYILIESSPIIDETTVSQGDEGKQHLLDFSNAANDHVAGLNRENTVVRESGSDRKKLLEPCMRLYLHPLDPHGVFRVSKPPLVLLRPQQSTEICVNFEPMHDFPYKQMLTVTCEMVNAAVGEGVVESSPVQPPRHIVTALLIGQGKLAKLSISRLGTSGKPIISDSTNGAVGKDTDTSASGVDVNTTEKEKSLVDFGTSAPFSHLEQKYEFRNNSSFALKVRSGVFNVVNRNPNHSIPFMIDPVFAIIPPKSSITTTVSFSPQAAGEFSSSVRILYGGGKSYHTLNLAGRCSCKPVFIVAPSNKVASSELIPGDTEVESKSVATLAKKHTLFEASPSKFLSNTLSLLPTCSTVPLGSSVWNPIVLTFNVSAKRSAIPTMPPDILPNKRVSSPQRGGSDKLGMSRSRQESVKSLNLNIDATTAIHHITVGMVRGYVNKAEFAVDGIDNTAIRRGWRVSMEGYTSCGGDEGVSGDDIHVPPGKTDNKRDSAANNINQMLQMAGQLSPTAFRGSLSSGQQTSILLSYTPTIVVLDSIPLNNVDITDIVNVRILVKGGCSPVVLPESDAAAYQRVTGTDAILGQDGTVMYLQLKGVVSSE